MGWSHKIHSEDLTPMNTTSTLSDALRRALEPPTSGFVGIVDNLLSLCRGGNLELAWCDGTCRGKIRRGATEESIEIPFRKPVFRAILARIAALCNEWHPDSVSPYAGQSELAVASDLPAVFQVTFVNTPDEQKLLISDSTQIGPIHPDGSCRHGNRARSGEESNGTGG